jgi:hypothetical protein
MDRYEVFVLKQQACEFIPSNRVSEHCQCSPEPCIQFCQKRRSLQKWEKEVSNFTSFPLSFPPNTKKNSHMVDETFSTGSPLALHFFSMD